MRHVIVTGGLGFIGSYVVRELLKVPEIRVTVVDNLSGTVFPMDRLVRSLHAPTINSLRVVADTVRYLERFREPCDTVFHLASVVGPAAVLHQAGRIAAGILRDAETVIDLARRCRARLVNVSTSEIYGGGAAGYCREDTARVVRGAASARQEYAAGKLAAEVAIENLCRLGELDAVSIRPFNVSGPGQSGRGGFVLPRFVGQALTGRPLTVFGDGCQVRAFTDARDIASGMLLCARLGESGTSYNIGNPANRISINTLAERVLEVTGSAFGLEHVDPRAIYGQSYAEAPDKYPDAERVMKLGWQPRFGLDDTIRDTCHYMQSLSGPDLLKVAGLEAESDAKAQEEVLAGQG